MSLLVSIIIPSAGRRPEFLQRAIKSALIDDDKIQTEIIVVLNGKDGMAFDTSLSIQHPLIKCYKIVEGNVSKARNFGLEKCKGELIRFLDDDDYLYSEVAYQQYLELFNYDADLSTYGGAIEDDIIRYQEIYPINLADYCAATLSASCPALTFASVYKSDVIKKLKWDEDIIVVEDEKWMRTIAASQEIKWIKSNSIVAVWYQHNIDRLSVSANYAHPELFKNRHISIQETLEILVNENRLTRNRKKIAAKGLWSCIHGGFYFAPLYWSKVALVARSLDPHSKPDDILYKILPQWINPLIVEWIILPKRWLNQIYRILKFKVGLGTNVRKF